jgi:hypothetical protein
VKTSAVPVVATVGIMAMLASACAQTTPPASFAYATPGPAAASPVASPAPTGSPPSSGSGAPLPSASALSAPVESAAPSIDPSTFVATIDNAWFPLIPGTTWTYTGTKDGDKAVDRVTVTRETKVVAGVTCVVVHDELTLGGDLAETTDDWYAQDTAGNVWYFGEATQELDGGKVVSTEGSWEAGVDAAQPGIFMPADPQVGLSGVQEFYPGHAEDRFVVLLTEAEVKVPAGSYTGVLVTAEWTLLEPDVLSQKAYAKGIGEIREADVAGGDEKLELTKTTAG